MTCINFGKVNLKFLIPVSGGIVRLIYAFLINLNPKYETALKNPFLLSIYNDIGMILAFIPYLIIKYRTKKSKYLTEVQNKSKLDIEFVHYDIFKKTRWSKYKLISLSAILDFLETILSYIFCSKFVYNLWSFDIIFISLFSYLILKTKLYKHQYISMIIILFLGLLLNIVEYFKYDEREKTLKPIEIIMTLLTEILFSLSLVLVKYNLEKNFCDPYEMCIFQGLIGLIIYIISLVVINKLELTIDNIKYPENFIEYKNSYDINDFLVCLIVIIVNFIFNISLFVTCNYFSPVHILITSLIKEYHYYLQSHENIILNILGIVILLLILFMFLVFIEIIELNVFNISYNTKKNIEKRSELDSFIDINNIVNLPDEIMDEEDKANTSFSSINDNLIQ